MKRKIILGVALTLIVATFCTVFLTGCWDTQKEKNYNKLEGIMVKFDNKAKVFSSKEVVKATSRNDLENIVITTPSEDATVVLKITNVSNTTLYVYEMNSCGLHESGMYQKLSPNASYTVTVDMKDAEPVIGGGCSGVFGYETIACKLYGKGAIEIKAVMRTK